MNINKQKINNLIFLKPFSPHGLGSHGLTVVVVVVVVVLVVVKEVSQRGPLNPGRHKQILEPSNKVKQFPLIQGGGFELHLKAGDNVEVVVVLCDGGISHLWPEKPPKHKQKAVPSNNGKQFPFKHGGGFWLHLFVGTNAVVVVVAEANTSHLWPV